jgi:hypothetical protein
VSVQSAAVGEPPESRAALVPLAIVVVVGAAVAWASGPRDASVPGAARLVAPDTLLAVLDTVVAILLVRPGRRDVLETLTLLATALPFHAAAAAAAGAGPGHHAASALAGAAWGAAGVVSARTAPALAGLLAGIVAFALPLAAYGLAEFARLPVGAAFLASPLTALSILARTAADARPADAVPALVVAGAVAGVAALVGRSSRTGAGA